MRSSPPAPRALRGVRAPGGPPGELGRRLAAAVVLGAVAIGAGAAAAQEPRLAVGLVVAGLVALLAFRAPVAHLLALIALTAIVPLDVQARFGSGGSVDSAGVLPSDVLLLTGLARALLVLPRQPLRRLTSAAIGLTALFLRRRGAAACCTRSSWGGPISGVGGEFRALLGFGTLFVALPVLADPPPAPPAAHRARLARPRAGALGDRAVRLAPALHATPTCRSTPGSFQTAGRVIGLFAFPVAATLALAVLTGGPSRARVGARALLAAVVITNLVAIVLTFERTFLLVTLIGFGLVFLRSATRASATASRSGRRPPSLLHGPRLRAARAGCALRLPRPPPHADQRQDRPRRAVPRRGEPADRRSRSARGPSTARRSAPPS